MMKKAIAVILAAVLALSVAGCNDAPEKEEDYAMYIETAQLTEEEENIADLLGADAGQLIYDFVLDDTVKSIQINTYELTDGEWKLVTGGGGQHFTGMEGRLALGFDDLAMGLRVALQGEGTGGSTTYAADAEDYDTSMSRAISMLSGRREIVYEEEIPLVVQISTTQNAINSYSVEYFFEPEKYVKHGYEYVAAITVRFSQKTVNELAAAD